MTPSFVSLLRSPEDGSPLQLAIGEYDAGDVLTGTLTDTAGRVYPIEDGIARLLPSSLLDAQKSEIAARDAQVADYDDMKMLALMGKWEIPWVRRWLGTQPTDRVLEAGCGTGRMTRLLCADAKEWTAIDFSFDSLRANAAKLRAAGVVNVNLVQADLCALPFAPGTFDRIVSAQVLEHVPRMEMQARAVEQLARVARPSARLVLSAYRASPLLVLIGKKQGEHPGGIPFFRFTREEMRDILSSHWDVETVHAGLGYVWMTRSTRR